MTVVFVAHTGLVSGAERMLLRLVDEACSTSDVTVVCPAGPLADSLPESVRHVPIPVLGMGGERGGARLAAAARMLGRWISAGRTLRSVTRRSVTRDEGTAVIVNSLFALPAARMARPAGGVAWLVHDAVASARQSAVTRLGRPVVRIAVACTEAAAGPVRAANVPVRVVPYGVRWPVEDYLTPVQTPPVVGMLALLTSWKGQHVLLDAVATLPDVVVELAGGTFPGDQDYEQALRTRAAEPDLQGRVRFLGHVDPDSVLRRWDAVISASVLPEAGPLSVLEAMSHGLPVVATDHGGPTEFLADGAGILVPPDDVHALAHAISTVLTDEELRSRLGRRARAAVETEHDIGVTMPALLRALTEPSTADAS